MRESVCDRGNGIPNYSSTYTDQGLGRKSRSCSTIRKQWQIGEIRPWISHWQYATLERAAAGPSMASWIWPSRFAKPIVFHCPRRPIPALSRPPARKEQSIVPLLFSLAFAGDAARLRGERNGLWTATFGVDGPITYKENPASFAKIVQSLPRNRIVVETEQAHTLTPEPYRGKAEQKPAYVSLRERRSGRSIGASAIEELRVS